ncbi:MBL fold metallo-hydrolase [Streptomyces sp. LBUM 1478]|nr:MBL fold metallo-hydrolase [Streptomyces sp. LBUM 1478]
MTVTWEECGWQELTPGVGRCRLPGWDCTAGLVVGDGAALVIDAGSSLREGARLRAEACRLLGGARVTHLALTHPHFDHVFGAAAFAGVEVFGAVGVDGVLGRDHEALRADAVHHGLPAADATEAADLLVRPRHLVSGEWTLDLGGEVRVLLANVGPGHTGHDLAVLVSGVLGRWCSAGTWSRSPASRRRAPTRSRPAGRPPWTGCWTSAARTRCTCPATGRWWTRRSSGPSVTPWRAASACRTEHGGIRARLLLSSLECASTHPT